MKNKKIIGSVLVGIILLGLLVFASTHKYEDSHLRVNGIRVKVEEGALVVNGCDEKTSTAIYCERPIELNGKIEKLVFELKNFKENGYPNAATASINGKEIIKKENLNIETNGSYDYQVFLNFETLGDYILFSYSKGLTERSTTLYAIDKDGNIILEETEIDTDDMRIKDYTEFITYEENSATVYATRVKEGATYKGENICYAKDNEIVEAKYTYTLKDGKFSKKQTEKITAKKYIEENKITCTNKE